jgi:hypothetical protein
VFAVVVIFLRNVKLKPEGKLRLLLIYIAVEVAFNTIIFGIMTYLDYLRNVSMVNLSAVVIPVLALAVGYAFVGHKYRL